MQDAKETEVFRITKFDKAKFYAYAPITKETVDKVSYRRKYYATDPLTYLGKHVSQTGVVGPAHDPEYTIELFENGVTIQKTETTGFQEVPMRENNQNGFDAPPPPPDATSRAKMCEDAKTTITEHNAQLSLFRKNPTAKYQDKVKELENKIKRANRILRNCLDTINETDEEHKFGGASVKYYQQKGKMKLNRTRTTEIRPRSTKITRRKRRTQRRNNKRR